MYGKIENGVFYRAPHRMSGEDALANGYKPVVLTPAPETDNEHYPVEWLEETETEIVRHWNVEAFPVDPDPELDDAEALEILMGGAT